MAASCALSRPSQRLLTGMCIFATRFLHEEKARRYNVLVVKCPGSALSFNSSVYSRITEIRA